MVVVLARPPKRARARTASAHVQGHPGVSGVLYSGLLVYERVLLRGLREVELTVEDLLHEVVERVLDKGVDDLRLGGVTEHFLALAFEHHLLVLRVLLASLAHARCILYAHRHERHDLALLGALEFDARGRLACFALAR